MKPATLRIALAVALTIAAVPAAAQPAADAAAELRAVRDELRELNTSIKQLLLLLNERQALDRRGALVAELAELDRGIAAMHQTLEKIEAEAAQMTAQVADERAELEAAETQVRNDSELARALGTEGRLEAYRARIATNEQRLGELQLRATELRGTLQRRKALRDRVEAELDAL